MTFLRQVKTLKPQRGSTLNVVLNFNAVPLSLSDIREVVETGDLTRLVGEMEGRHLDAKSQPYHFGKGNDTKREFAKDVAAFANADGGCIVVGAETTIPRLQAGEQISALKPFPRSLFDPDQHDKVIAEWIFPMPIGVRFEWYPDGNAPTSGISLVFIPTQNPQTKPFLLTRTIGDKKTTELLLGYAERRLDRTEIKTIVELHHALRTGMNLEATLLDRVSSLEALLQRQLNATSVLPSSTPVSQTITAARVAGIFRQEPLKTDRRKLIIVVTPAPPSELRSLFSQHPNSIRRALEAPSELRPNGWGLRTGAIARSIGGEFVQTESSREVINLYRDGQFIVSSRIDRDSLAWSDERDARIHPLAFAEFVTNTLVFYQLVLADMRTSPQTLQIEMRLTNLTPDGETTTLPAGTINNMGWTSGGRSALAEASACTITVDAATYDAARAAFLLLREIYVWFGHTDEDVPYTKGTADDRMMDTAAIAVIK